MKTDVKRIKVDIATVTEQIREAKTRRGRVGWTWRDAADLCSLKIRATLLCSLQAHRRGKVHARGTTIESQADLVSGLLKDYLVEEVTTQEAA